MEGRTASRVRGLLGIACLWAAAAPLVAQPAPADLLLVDGRVYTFAWDEPSPDGTPAANAPRSADGFRPDAEALAIRGDRIVFVGSTAKAQAYRGPKTRVMDLRGATVLPGLVDSHTHVVGLGEAQSQVDLVGVATEAEAVARVAAFAKGVPKGQWILGRGWDEGAWANHYPTKQLLSERVPGPSGPALGPSHLRGVGEPARPRARRPHAGSDGARGRNDRQGRRTASPRASSSTARRRC